MLAQSCSSWGRSIAYITLRATEVDLSSLALGTKTSDIAREVRTSVKRWARTMSDILF